jgi:hypothetical protein
MSIEGAVSPCLVETAELAAKVLSARTGPAAPRTLETGSAARAQTHLWVGAQARTVAPVGAGGHGPPRRLVLAAQESAANSGGCLPDRVDLANREAALGPEMSA